MKYSKEGSLSTDTRLSRSGILNNSSINGVEANVNNSYETNFYMSNNIKNCENKEVEFLRIKNGELEQKNKRLIQEIESLEKIRQKS